MAMFPDSGLDILSSEELYLQSLNDSVSSLESTFARLTKSSKLKIAEGKYTQMIEIKSSVDNGFDQTYKWVVEVKDGNKKGDPVNKNYKFTVEIKGKGENSNIIRTYKFEASSCNACERSKPSEETVDSKKKIKKTGSDHGDVVLRQAFSKGVEKVRGKRKEHSPHDAATLIQMSFRAYLTRRSQALRALREMAIAKTKLKEIKALFNNFTYRRRVARDAKEWQKFTDKIIVSLLTVDAIEGSDRMVRTAKKSMVNELEAMFDVLDPQQADS